MKKLVIAVLLGVVCLSAGVQVRAQGFPEIPAKPQTQTAKTEEDETNLETHLFLIVASNQDVVDSKLPSSLDGIVRQLRASLPFKNYRLVSTLINRVKNDGSLKLNWVGAPMTSIAATAPTAPSFSYFNIRQVRLVRNNENQQMIQMAGFSFGARVPIQMSAVAANGEVKPTTSYEQTGLGTDISMKEAEPVIVGTLNVGPSGDAIILVVSAKRASN